MSGRALRRPIAGINQWACRSRTHVEGRDIRETGIRSLDRSGPRRGNQRRSGRNPVIATGAHATRDPTYTRFQHDLVDRCTTDAEEHVVVHFETLDAFKDLDAWTHLALSQDERVVDKAITSIGVSGAVPTDAGHACALRSHVLKNISDHVRILAGCIGCNVLVAMRIRSNQLNLSVEAARDPVVINFVALRSTLDVIAAVLIVQVTILHAKHRTRMHELVRGHVDRMLAGTTAAVMDLNIFHQQRARTRVGAKYSVRWTIMNHAVTQRNIVRVVIDTSEAAAGNVESFEHVMIRQTKFHRVRAARDHGPQPIDADSSDRNLVYRRAGDGEYQIPRIGRVTVDFRQITRLKQRCDILQFLKRSRWTYLISDCERGAATSRNHE